MPRGRSNDDVWQFQNFVYNSLKSIFGEASVKKEWNVAKDSRDDFTRKLYCPRLDIAIGPFNIHRNIYEDRERINRTVNVHRNLMEKLWRVSELKLFTFQEFLRNRNKNPRCMIAIEIENSGSSKHMLGNITNVSILGSIGIVIPYNETKTSLCKRIKKYVTFATEVGKIGDVFRNILIIRKDKFLRVLNKERKKWQVDEE